MYQSLSGIHGIYEALFAPTVFDNDAGIADGIVAFFTSTIFHIISTVVTLCALVIGLHHLLSRLCMLPILLQNRSIIRLSSIFSGL